MRAICRSGGKNSAFFACLDRPAPAERQGAGREEQRVGKGAQCITDMSYK
ncbi:hypothetical protein ACGWJW_000807 [Enterococcus hirae]